MTSPRREHILDLLAQGDEPAATSRLCDIGAKVTGATGAGIMLMSGDVPRGSICTTDPVSALIEQLQYDLGEGPCVDAYSLDLPVSEPDLAAPTVPRWLAFAGPALDAGARAVFGFPMRVGSIRLGALNLYSVHPGPLTDDQHADALLMADVAAETMLLLQAQAPPGMVAGELEAGADFQYVVHQAAGMVAVQIGVTIAQAVVRIRAYAFGNGLALGDVAAAVVARTLRFHPDAPNEPSQ